MHPGPMNRGVEIGSEVADDIDRSLIRSQVEMGVAIRMACLEIMARDLGNGPARSNEAAPMSGLRRLIRGARLLDPESGLDETGDLIVVDDRIAAIGHDIRAATQDGTRRRDRRGRRAVPRARPRRHARAIARARRRAHGIDRERRPGRGGGRGDDDGRIAQHRAAGRRRLGGRVPRPPGARGQARQGPHLCRRHQGHERQGADRDRPARGERRARLYRRGQGDRRRASNAASAGLCPQL